MANSADSDPIHEQQDRLSDDVDAIVDEIDEVLSESAEEFVRSYIQKGGQGWSTFVDPSFFVGAATAGLVASATYDAFKKVVARVVHSISKIPGPVQTRVYEEDGSITSDFEYVLEEAWETAEALLRNNRARHSIDEATALHWALFVREFLKSEPFIKLDMEQFEKLRRAGGSRPEKLTPSQIAAHVIGQWLMRNPNAEIGIWE